jgi:hypothetical protein
MSLPTETMVGYLIQNGTDDLINVQDAAVQNFLTNFQAAEPLLRVKGYSRIWHNWKEDNYDIILEAFDYCVLNGIITLGENDQ